MHPLWYSNNWLILIYMAIKWWMLQLYNGKNVEAEDWDYVMALPVPTTSWSATVYGHEIHTIKKSWLQQFCYIWLGTILSYRKKCSYLDVNPLSLLKRWMVLFSTAKLLTSIYFLYSSETQQWIHAITLSLSNLHKDLGKIQTTCDKDKEFHSLSIHFRNCTFLHSEYSD